MQRLSRRPRWNWKREVESLGLVWNTLENGEPYWDESAYYRFTADQIDQIEEATGELQRLCLAAGQHILDNNLFGQMGIPESAVPFIRRAWEEEPPALAHGRFDLAYDGVHPPKMLEYNADTPTALLEAAVIQWAWKEASFPQADQFNSIHERLVRKWKDIRARLKSNLVHFTHFDDGSGEDTMTAAYLRDTAQEAGLDTVGIIIDDIGWESESRRFVDQVGLPIDNLFHLYPWEWLVNEAFAENIWESYDRMFWIEPIWKMLWSNKGLLAVLWELFPDHPSLLEARIGDPGRMTDYVQKPLLAREGANVSLVVHGDQVLSTPGDYGEEGYVYQQWYPIPEQEGRYPVLGSWIVDGEPAGLGIREGGLITGNRSHFVPHIFE
jgi:glutathionylspermidine synthase